MDVQYQIIKSSRSFQKQIVVSISGCPTFLLFFFMKQLLFSIGTFSQLWTCKTHTLISFNVHTSLPGHHFECSQCWIQSCRHDVSHRDFFASTHNLLLWTPHSSPPPSSEEIHGHKCYSIYHFIRTMLTLWWETFQLGIISRFQSLTTC